MKLVEKASWSVLLTMTTFLLMRVSNAIMCPMCDMKFTNKRTLNNNVYHFHPNETANIVYNYYK